MTHRCHGWLLCLGSVADDVFSCMIRWVYAPLLVCSPSEYCFPVTPAPWLGWFHFSPCYHIHYLLCLFIVVLFFVNGCISVCCCIVMSYWWSQIPQGRLATTIMDSCLTGSIVITLDSFFFHRNLGGKKCFWSPLKTWKFHGPGSQPFLYSGIPSVTALDLQHRVSLTLLSSILFIRPRLDRWDRLTLGRGHFGVIPMIISSW